MDKDLRHKRAVKASCERWHPTIPRATHSGILILGELEIPCDVLVDGRRVIRSREFLKSVGRSVKPGSDTKSRALAKNVPVFISANNLTPYLKPELTTDALEVNYKSASGKKLKGYEAKILTETCEVYLKAREEGVLTKDQNHIAHACEIMMRAFAKVGLIALIDESTGYQEVRERNELQKILDKYISEELRAWTQKFPNEFFKQIYRLYGWEYNASPKRPQCIGHIINKYVYEKLPPGVLEELKRKNPVNENGNRKYRFHQFLTEDIGNENLQKQIVQTITLMKVSDNIDHFNELIERL